MEDGADEDDDDNDDDDAPGPSMRSGESDNAFKTSSESASTFSTG